MSFLWTPIFRAWPGLKDAALTRHCCRGEIMCTSRAAERPWCHVGMRMSAGRERESDTTPEGSRDGARAADWAAA